MTAATWGCCPRRGRPGELLTRGDVCHVHADRAAAERCGVLLGPRSTAWRGRCPAPRAAGYVAALRVWAATAEPEPEPSPCPQRPRTARAGCPAGGVAPSAPPAGSSPACLGVDHPPAPPRVPTLQRAASVKMS